MARARPLCPLGSSDSTRGRNFEQKLTQNLISCRKGTFFFLLSYFP